MDLSESEYETMTGRNEAKSVSLLARTALYAVAVGLPLFTLMRSLDEIIVKVFEETGAYVLIERYVSPVLARVTGSVLMFVFNVEAAVRGGSIYLMSGGLPYELHLSWNCTGWQSLVFLGVCLAILLQGSHTLKSRVKCIILGMEGIVAVNLFRIAASALILVRWGYAPAMAFHDYVGPLSTTAWLAVFWVVSNRYILKTSMGQEEASFASRAKGALRGLRLRSILPDFIFGKRTMAVTTMAIILTMTVLGGIGALSTRVEASSGGHTSLSFEYEASAITVNTITTNRILTHPGYTDLGTIHTDSYTAGDKNWNEVWNFYLHGHLGQPYTLTGKVTLKMFFYASQKGKVNVRFTIYDVNETGSSTYVAHYDEEKKLDDESPDNPLIYVTEKLDPYTFASGHTVRIRIDIRTSYPGRTYHFDYDSEDKHSRMDLPSIVISERLMPMISLTLFSLPVVGISRRGTNTRRKNVLQRLTSFLL